ncbi:glycosyltransferase family 2 protein [Gammaproteobacteria bacterium]|nr:glycosyltransferase family 2 protein [Gammaproteobacteria bacterium]
MLKIAVIVPCFNEVQFIEPFINNVFSQKIDDLEVELIIVDGMSVDGTREFLETVSNESIPVRVIDNPDQIVPVALNIAIKNTDADIIVRMDCHTIYSDNYIYQCVNKLINSKADCVGGAWQPKATGLLSKAIAVAFLSPIGSGAAKSRDSNYDGEVDTVYLGCWTRDRLLSIGMFDESLVRNQDDELCLRLIKDGGIIYQSSEIRSSYFVRNSYSRLIKQFYQYGFWKPAVAKKHGQVAAIRHLIPGLFVLAQAFLFIVSLIFSKAYIFYFVAFYMLCLILSAIIYNSDKFTLGERLLSIICIAAMHYSYGIGTLVGIFRQVFMASRVDISISR